MIRRVRAALFVAVAALGLAAFAAVAGAGTPSGRIVFAATDAPANGDVMLVRADGSELDLSASPALDTGPVVSPTGKLVAFYSTRGGHGAEWVVGIDGTGLRQVTPPLADTALQVAWAPNGRDLAVVDNNAVHRASAAGGVWVRIDRRDQPTQLAGWSPDGTRVAYVSGLLANVVVVNRSGKLLRSVVGLSALWSPTGRLAVQSNSQTWVIYGTNGKRLARVVAVAAAWSPHGRLASITANGLVQVRAGGVGKPLVSARPIRHASGLIWADETHLLVSGENGYVSYDLAHKATFELAAAYRFSPSLARDGSAYGESPWGTLAHSTLSGSTRVVATVPYCQGKDADAFESLQALPDGSGAVYAGDCAAPHDIFTVQPDGTALTRVTDTTNEELDPSLSPDGTKVAFARVDSANCAGCEHVIWIMNLDGSGAVSIPLPSQKLNPILQDDRPSFSPDGMHLVFARWNSAVSDEAFLYVASVAGTGATSLKVNGGDAAWGPTGIAFDGPKGVEMMAADGSDLRAVPGTKKLGSGVPAWSNDGRLALLEYEQGFSILLPATGKRLALPGLRAPQFAPPGLAWSPDGSRLAFTAVATDGAADVWTIAVDGTGLTRVTHDLDVSGALSWR
jgi:Tol biopolymer transport system component